MSIFSVALERGLEQGLERGRAQGEIRGKDAKLIDMICKKLRKGKPLAVIADELEEDIELIQQICEIASAFAPEYDSEKVVELWLSKNSK